MTLKSVRSWTKVIKSVEGQSDWIEWFSSFCSWSALAKVGTAPVMRMTILVPLIGMFLIFNETVSGIIAFAPRFLTDIGISTSPEAGGYAWRNVYLLYFGLCSLGIGSMIFAVACPDNVKYEPHIMSYVSGPERMETPVVAKTDFRFVLDNYFKYQRTGDDPHLKYPEYPANTEAAFYDLIREMFDTYLKDIHLPDSESEEDDFMSGFYTASGYPDIEKIAHAVWSSPKVIWVFTMSFWALAPQFSKDIAFVKYLTLDASNFAGRIAVVLLYTCGFMLISIPTIETFLRLLFVALFQ